MFPRKPKNRANRRLMSAAAVALNALMIVLPSAYAQSAVQAKAATPVKEAAAPSTSSAPSTPSAEDPPAPAGWYGPPGDRKVAPPLRDMTKQELAVVDRATARQQALSKGEYKAAYEFLSLASQSFKSFAAFESEAAGSALRDVKATRAECDKDSRCSVTLIGQAVIRQPRVRELSVPVLLQEVWIAQVSGEAQLILR